MIEMVYPINFPGNAKNICYYLPTSLVSTRHFRRPILVPNGIGVHLACAQIIVSTDICAIDTVKSDPRKTYWARRKKGIFSFGN